MLLDVVGTAPRSRCRETDSDQPLFSRSWIDKLAREPLSIQRWLPLGEVGTVCLPLTIRDGCEVGLVRHSMPRQNHITAKLATAEASGASTGRAKWGNALNTDNVTTGEMEALAIPFRHLCDLRGLSV